MADFKYPLIVDTANLRIKELPLGDLLDFTGGGIANIAVERFSVQGGIAGQILATYDGAGNLFWQDTASGFPGEIIQATTATTGFLPVQSGSLNTYNSAAYPNIAPAYANILITTSSDTATGDIVGGMYVAEGEFLFTEAPSTVYDYNSTSTATNSYPTLPFSLVSGTAYNIQAPAFNGGQHCVARYGTSTDEIALITSSFGTWTTNNIGLVLANGWQVIAHGTRFIAWGYKASTDPSLPNTLVFYYNDNNGFGPWTAAGYVYSPAITSPLTDAWIIKSGYPTNNTLMGVLTNHTGVIISRDGGLSWAYFNDRLPYSSHHGIAWVNSYWIVTSSSGNAQFSYDGIIWHSYPTPACISPVRSGDRCVSLQASGNGYILFINPWGKITTENVSSGTVTNCVLVGTESLYAGSGGEKIFVSEKNTGGGNVLNTYEYANTSSTFTITPMSVDTTVTTYNSTFWIKT